MKKNKLQEMVNYKNFKQKKTKQKERYYPFEIFERRKSERSFSTRKQALWTFNHWVSRTKHSFTTTKYSKITVYRQNYVREYHYCLPEKSEPTKRNLLLMIIKHNRSSLCNWNLTEWFYSFGYYQPESTDRQY